MKGNTDMADYILSCCSAADLTKEHFERINVQYICMHFMLDGVTYADDKPDVIAKLKALIAAGEYPDGLWK